jgi:Gpi18-like mannosyltransferase
MQIFLLWLLLRISSFLIAAKASSVHAFNAFESSLPAWPPSIPLGLWLQRVVVTPLFHWDALQYLSIATRGYNASDSSTAYYPLFPWSAKLLSLLGIDPAVGLLLISAVASLAFIYVFERMARLDLPNDKARSAALTLLIFPISMVFFIPYTEGMFFLFAALCFIAARHQRWWLAALFGVLATLTKVAGVVLVVALIIELWGDPANRRWSWIILQKWASVLCIPATFVIWTIVRNQIVNQIRFDIPHFQQWFLSLLISPSADMTESRTTFLWPWQLFIETIDRAIHDPVARLHVVLTLGGFTVMVLLLVLTWRFLRPSYRIYSLLLILYSPLIFSFYNGALPLMSAF